MHRVQLHYTLSRDASAALVRHPLIDLLQAVDAQGSISAAARALGLSYRHVWGELKRWENELGNELIVWEKGQSARLSEFGAKLMWAERQAQARLSPQIEALRADLERAFAVAFDPAAHVLTLYASHDDALPALRAHAAQQANLHLDIRFTGSVDAIAALNEGRCIMAGFHTLAQPAPDSMTARTYRPLLQPGLHKIIGFARRTQGLMVAPGNPLGLRSLADVARTARALRQPAPGLRHTGAARRPAGRRRAGRAATSRATRTPSPRTRPWRKPLRRARPIPAWASSSPRARAGWTSCRWRRRTTTWSA